MTKKKKVAVILSACIMLSCTGISTDSDKGAVSAKQMQELVDNVSIEFKESNNDSIESYQANHFNEPSHKTIWGKGGSASYDENSPDESKRQRLKYGSIQRDGILWKCFNEKKWIVYDRNGETLK